MAPPPLHSLCIPLLHWLGIAQLLHPCSLARQQIHPPKACADEDVPRTRTRPWIWPPSEGGVQASIGQVWTRHLAPAAPASRPSLPTQFLDCACHSDSAMQFLSLSSALNGARVGLPLQGSGRAGGLAGGRETTDAGCPRSKALPHRERDVRHVRGWPWAATEQGAAPLRWPRPHHITSHVDSTPLPPNVTVLGKPVPHEKTYLIVTHPPYDATGPVQGCANLSRSATAPHRVGQRAHYGIKESHGRSFEVGGTL